MKRGPWAWGAAAAALVLGGGVAACTAISGLASYTDCSGDCDASTGHTPPGDDSSVTPMDATQAPPVDDQQSPEETGPVGDDTDDGGGDANGGSDAGEPTTDSGEAGEAGASMDSGATAEAGAAHDGGAASGDGGCSSTNSVHDCSACGLACDTTTGTPSCNGVSCSYACDSNKIDCNFAAAPDTDGCECPGTACCGSVCQTTHASGIPSPASYYNCSPTGNSNISDATSVCLSVGGSACTAQTATCPLFTGVTTSAVCGMVSNACYCWVYSGMGSGTVSSPAFGPCNIPCQSGTVWN